MRGLPLRFAHMFPYGLGYHSQHEMSPWLGLSFVFGCALGKNCIRAKRVGGRIESEGCVRWTGCGNVGEAREVVLAMACFKVGASPGESVRRGVARL